MTIRAAAVSLAVALLGSAAPAATATDRVVELIGDWTCRTEYGYPGRLSVAGDGDVVKVAAETRYPSATLAHHERYLRGRASAGWSVESDDDFGFAGRGPAWTGAAWRLEGVMRSRSTGTSAAARVLYERRDDGLLRITRSASDPLPSRYVELCRRGGAPPDPAACVVPDLPAVALSAGEPDVPWTGPSSGTVQVSVALDADSKLVSATIVSSPSALLSASALTMARRSSFHTALRDCRPVPSTYLFTVDFNVR